MYFLVIEKAVTPAPHPNLRERMKIVTAHYDYYNELQKQGKVLHYSWVGTPGGVNIFNVKDNNELDILIANGPRFRFCTYEIAPLMTLEDARKVAGQLKEKADREGT